MHLNILFCCAQFWPKWDQWRPMKFSLLNTSLAGEKYIWSFKLHTHTDLPAWMHQRIRPWNELFQTKSIDMTYLINCHRSAWSFITSVLCQKNVESREEKYTRIFSLGYFEWSLISWVSHLSSFFSCIKYKYSSENDALTYAFSDF